MSQTSLENTFQLPHQTHILDRTQFTYLNHPAYHWHEAEEDERSCENGENNCKHYSECDAAWKLISIPVGQAGCIDGEAYSDHSDHKGLFSPDQAVE